MESTHHHLWSILHKNLQVQFSHEETIALLQVELCSSKIPVLKSCALVPQNVTLFGNGHFEDALDKLGHTG
jgi:hypothetical protein